jgi:hypothetical protein
MLTSRRKYYTGQAVEPMGEERTPPRIYVQQKKSFLERWLPVADLRPGWGLSENRKGHIDRGESV